MEFQQGMSLLVATAASLVGVGISWGVLRTFTNVKIQNLESRLKEIKEDFDKRLMEAKLDTEAKVIERKIALDRLMDKVVYKDACKQCESKWIENHMNLKEDISEITTDVKEVGKKLDDLILYLIKQKEA